MNRLVSVRRFCCIIDESGKQIGLVEFERSIDDHGKRGAWKPVRSEDALRFFSLFWDVERCKAQLIERRYTWQWTEAELRYGNV